MKYGIVRSVDYDWVGLYVDGQLVHEGHSIQEEDMLRALGFDFALYVAPDSLDKWGNCCPDQFPIEEQPTEEMEALPE